MLRKISKPIIGLLLVLGSATASATTYNFTGINADQEDLTGQLSVSVEQTGTSVSFNFVNDGGMEVESFIRTIYFDFLGTNLFSTLNQTGSTGFVNFITSASSNSNLPEGENLDPDFTTDASAVRATGKDLAGSGIDLGESLLLTATLSSNIDILNLLNTGGLRIGLHVQGIGVNDQSDSYVNTPPNAVPLPAAGWLFGSALIGLMGLSRRKL
ncbi:MAG: VPLPA-CTERM sorting domain-containing protein [Pseudomonadota bacterium]